MAWVQDNYRIIFLQYNWPAHLCWQKGPTVDLISQEILAGGIQEKSLFYHSSCPLDYLATGDKIHLLSKSL